MKLLGRNTSMISNYLIFVMEAIINFKQILVVDTVDLTEDVSQLYKIAGWKKIRWGQKYI